MIAFCFGAACRDENRTHWGGDWQLPNAFIATTQKPSSTIINFAEKTALFSAASGRYVEPCRNLVEKRRLDLSNATPQH